MSTPNINYSNLDSRYTKPTDVDAKIASQATTDAAQFMPSTIVGQNVIGLGSNWSMVLSTASQLDTASMGTLKALGVPYNAIETQYDAISSPPAVSSDGTVTCATVTPAATSTNGSTTAVYATSTVRYTNSWVHPELVVGAGDTNRATWTSATAYDVAALDLAYSLPALPTGASLYSVTVNVGCFASSDSTMPFTIELIDATGVHIGSAAQPANAQGNFTFTGVSNAQLAAGLYTRLKVTHNSTTTSATVSYDDTSIVLNYATTASLTYHYRSEFIYTSDRIDGANDYTNFRFTEGQRIRLAFDVLTHGMNAQSSDNWNCIFQGIGKAIDGSFPYAPMSIQVIQGQWRLQHGQGIDIGYMGTHEDERWTRWELDILLGRAGTGTVKAWLDGTSIGTWTPTAGTFYAGNGNNSLDLQWIYFKNGLYGAATTSPTLPSAVFRNRRFTVSNADGTGATTWRSPHVSSTGLHVFRRNSTTDMPY